MKRGYVLIAVVFAFAFAGCKDPASSSGSAPVITEVKISSVNNYLTPNIVTTLNTGTEYYVFIYFSDQDLDVSQIMVATSNGTQTNEPSTIPVADGQTTITATLYFPYTPTTTGTWTNSVYLVDSKGNTSNTKSVTVTVQ